MQKIKLNSSEKDQRILLPGYKNFNQWRNMWKKFFGNILDECIVFSNSTKNLFIKVYPELKTKIKVLPHKVRLLPKVVVKKHDGINIAMLGNMNPIIKGSDIIAELCKSNKKDYVKFFIIGSYKRKLKNLTVSGKYKPEELPLYIKKYQIDIVFIPSICPETFSYTTSEAMMMGVPVACFNFGAQAEKVKKYSKGLVIDSLDAGPILNQIIQFIQKDRS